MVACEVRVWYPSGVVPCGEPATVVLTSGCVHEHLVDTAMCSKDEGYARDASRRGLLQCKLCLNAGSPHVPVAVVSSRDLRGS